MGLAAAFERRDTEADETNQWVKLSSPFKMISCNAKQDAARLRFLKNGIPEPSRTFQNLPGPLVRVAAASPRYQGCSDCRPPGESGFKLCICGGNLVIFNPLMAVLVKATCTRPGAEGRRMSGGAESHAVVQHTEGCCPFSSSHEPALGICLL